MAKVDISKAITKIHALGNVMHRPMRDVLDSWARVTAISCAKSTQPATKGSLTGSEAQQVGMKAVARDIAKVYKTPGGAYEDINQRYQGAFWKAYKDGDIDRAQAILDANGRTLRGVPMEQFDGGSAHKAARNTTTGRVNQKRPSMIITNPKALAKYVEEEQKHVGTGKGGWADVVRAIGGHNPRGLREEGDITANWITRRAHGYGKAFQGGTDEHPTITIESRVPYADHILSGGLRRDAIRIGRERTIENLQHAVRAEARKLRSAA
jgi:hypothetical protein